MIALTDVTKVYRLGRVEVHALRGVTMTIDRGEWLAIMGPSGGGKSSLLHVVGCLDKPTAGSYRLDGQEVSGMGDDALAELRGRRFGFVFQSFNLLPRAPAWRQVALPLQYARNGVRFADREARARAVLAEVGLGDRMDHRPSELSGGQSQRVAIARALVADPAVILADEPTGNLDSRSGAEVVDLLDRLHRDRELTIVMVTHDEEVAARAGRTVRIRDGALVEERARARA